MRQVPLERDINLAINGCSGFAPNALGDFAPLTLLSFFESLIAAVFAHRAIHPLIRLQLNKILLQHMTATTAHNAAGGLLRRK